MQATAKIGVVGASGYAGLEATRLLACHPSVELRFVSSDRWRGEALGGRLPIHGSAAQLRYLSESEAPFADCDLVVLATPAEVSATLAARVLEAGARVIDLSGAFRLKSAEDLRRHYPQASVDESVRALAVYGLPELFRSRIVEARLVANPGCYPTAAILALAPLLRAGLLDPSSLIVNAASGVTGAGRQSSEAYSFAELEGDFRAYKILKHQHTPEISQALASAAGRDVPLTFQPHLLPVRRGILCTSYASLAEGVSGAQLLPALRDCYAAASFVSVVDAPEEVTLRSVVGTNRCAIAVAHDEHGADPKRVIVFSAIDNLLKGAAGQAVQNLNLLMGWDETTGLTQLTGALP